MLKVLLENGGNPNIQEKNKPVLNIAVRQLRIENAKLLVDAGANLDFIDSSGSTAAEEAVRFGRYDIAYYILEHGLSANIINLAKTVDFRKVTPGSDQEEWRNKTIQYLEQNKGIKFPIFKNAK